MKRWSALSRLLTVIGLTLLSWAIAFLAIYGAVRLAERFGIC